MKIDCEDDIIPEGYIRVTEPLKAFSGLHNIDPAVVEHAADRGRRVHKFCELYALNMLVINVDEDCKNFVDSFIRWYDVNVETLVHAETRINCPRLMLSGQFDLLVILKGDIRPTLIDIKTPSKPSLTWPLQTAAYQSLIGDHLGVWPHKRACLMLPKKGDRERLIEYPNHVEDLTLYLKALDLYRYFNK